MPPLSPTCTPNTPALPRHLSRSAAQDQLSLFRLRHFPNFFTGDCRKLSLFSTLSATSISHRQISGALSPSRAQLSGVLNAAGAVVRITGGKLSKTNSRCRKGSQTYLLLITRKKYMFAHCKILTDGIVAFWSCNLKSTLIY